MLVVPPVVGATLAGWTWRHALLLAAWLTGYLAYHAAGLWLRARRRPRYRPPVLAYGAAAVVPAAALLASAPHLWVWGPVLAVLLAASLLASWRRDDRSWWNDVVTQVAAVLLTPVAAGLGPERTDPWRLDGDVWAATAVLLAYFLGTVPYVKSMIRERGNPAVLRVSAGYHVVVAGLGWLVDPLLGLVGTLLAARAVLVPRRWPAATPAAVGAGEVVATAVVTAALLLVAR